MNAAVSSQVRKTAQNCAGYVHGTTVTNLCNRHQFLKEAFVTELISIGATARPGRFGGVDYVMTPEAAKAIASVPSTPLTPVYAPQPLPVSDPAVTRPQGSTFTPPRSRAAAFSSSYEANFAALTEAEEAEQQVLGIIQHLRGANGEKARARLAELNRKAPPPMVSADERAAEIADAIIAYLPRNRAKASGPTPPPSPPPNAPENDAPETEDEAVDAITKFLPRRRAKS